MRSRKAPARQGYGAGRLQQNDRLGAAAPFGKPALHGDWPRTPAGRHLFLKLGWRFSMKAVMPSFWSSVPKVDWKTRRSKRMPSASVVS
ncbi:hypothetical protein BN1110_01594 [bacterium YEK0313]|nr:hypothetical protein BN1110_01594 [bacterium YEK0313]